MKKAQALASTVLELVRPTRIDHLTITGLDVKDTEQLAEGDGIRVMLLDKTAPDKVTLAGELWSDPVRKEVAVGAAFSRAERGVRVRRGRASTTCRPPSR